MNELMVRDVMTTDVVTVRADTPFKELVQAMAERRVSGVPVVGEDGTLVGIVTEADLLIAEEEAEEPRRRRSFLEWFIHPTRLADIEGRADGVRARDIMTRTVVTVGPDVPLREALKVLLDAGVRRLPVVDADERVVGIVSRRDLLSPFLRPDPEIGREIEQEVIVHTMWIDPATIRVRVDEGVAELEGRVPTRSTKEILLELVRRVDGVVGIVDHVTYGVDDRKARMQEAFSAPRRPENWIRIGR